MRVVFMGTPDFAVPTLQVLLDSRHDVVGVDTAGPSEGTERKAAAFPGQGKGNGGRRAGITAGKGQGSGIFSGA